MTVKAEFRVAVGRPYEYISLFIEEQDEVCLARSIDNMDNESILKLGEFHRNLGGALQTAWDMGHEAALKLLTEGLGATVESVEPVSVGEDPPGDVANAMTRPWDRKMETVTKPWEAPKVADLGDF